MRSTQICQEDQNTGWEPLAALSVLKQGKDNSSTILYPYLVRWMQYTGILHARRLHAAAAGALPWTPHTGLEHQLWRQCESRSSRLRHTVPSTINSSILLLRQANQDRPRRNAASWGAGAGPRLQAVDARSCNARCAIRYRTVGGERYLLELH